MHQYLRAIGFSDIKTKKELRDILHMVVDGHDTMDHIETDRSTSIVEYTKMVAGPCGICVRGEVEEEKNLVLDFYFPYLRPSVVTTVEEVSIERHAAKESFAGVCEDNRVGATIIYYLQNGVEYMRTYADKGLGKGEKVISLTGLSLSGTVLLPIKKNEKELSKVKQASSNRLQKIAAAKEGNEEALESLTIEDLDTYAAISQRIHKEDLFTLIDTYFMPYGIECDQYSVLAEIEECRLYQNYITDEEIYVMTLNMNEFVFDICINKKDLLGEPVPGRRFKGSLWLQGKVDFSYIE